MKQLYPIGQQNFKEIREEGRVYIDKTRFIPKLLANKFYFLSRPRRFGKSLFLSTLENFFLGRRHLFEGLAVDSMEWDWQTYPVVRINLGEGDYFRAEGLQERLFEIFDEVEARYEVSSDGPTPRARLRGLLMALERKFGKKVVVLVDEYEKPLLDAIEEPHFEQYRKELHAFYSVFKNNEEYIQLLFLTGITRFGHLNIFSGLNNIRDISLNEEYSAVCGITEEEISQGLKEGVESFAAKNGLSVPEALSQLKTYYDGYHFSRSLTDVYNPFSLLSCLSDGRLSPTWFETGSSSYLLKLLRETRYDLTDFENVTASEDRLKGTDSSMKDALTLLYQSGYLTIKKYDPESRVYTLGLPNYEVANALYSAIIPFYLGASYDSDAEKVMKFSRMLSHGKADEAMEWLKGFFSRIPYDVKMDYERDFQYIIYSFFALAGLQAGVVLEKQTSDGRIDMVLEMPDYVYVFEFKLGLDAEKALTQIESKDYSLQWRADGRKVIEIGVAFSPQARGIADYAIRTTGL